MRTLELSGASIVLLGIFSPAQFHPEWLASFGAISSQEATALKIEVLHPDITVLNNDDFDIRVESEKLTISTVKDPAIRIYDIVLKIFREALPFHNIYRMGINRIAHFKAHNVTDYCEFGDRLAPKEPWGEFGRDLLKTDEEGIRGGMESLVMIEPKRKPKHKYNGVYRVKVAASNRVKYGIFIEVNDDYQVDRESAQKSLPLIIDILEERWDMSLQAADKLIGHFRGL